MNPKYCITCGTKLKHKDKIIGYDNQTGEGITSRKYTCPSKKWYALFHVVKPDIYRREWY